MTKASQGAITNFQKLRVAIVHQSYWLERGQERLLQEVTMIFPQAELFFLFGDLVNVQAKFKGRKVHFSGLQKVPFIRRLYRYTLPLWPIYYEKFDFSNFDLVISLSSSFAKGVITGVDTRHISIITTPTRYLWDQAALYLKESSWIRRMFMRLLYTPLRMWDVLSSERPDKIIAISKFVSHRIKKYYGIDADVVIYPPVDLSKCHSSNLKAEYYIAVSPFEENKRGDLVIDLAIKTGIQLKVLGEGNLSRSVKKRASGYKNIEFVGWVSDTEKYELMSKAKGLIYPGVEDFGIVPVEAIASGCPVLAYAGGGALETVVERVNGVLVNEQSIEAFEEGLKRLNSLKFNEAQMRATVEKFDKSYFKQALIQFVQKHLD